MQIVMRKSQTAATRAEAGPVLGILVLAAAVSVAFGYVVSRGDRTSDVAVGAAAIVVFGVILKRFGDMALFAWVVLCGVAYPFIRYPSQHTLVTFDRVWISGLIVALLISIRESKGTRTSGLVAFAVLWLTFAAGVRAITTSSVSAHLSVFTTWLDAFVLPAGLFFAARRFVQAPEHLRSLARALTVGGLVLSVLAIAEKLVGFELATYSGGTLVSELGGAAVRITGPFSYPEMLATALLVCLAATIFLLQLRGGLTLALGLPLVAVELSAIGLTLFRTAWIAAVIVTVITLALRPRRIVRLVLTALIAGGIALAAIGPLEGNQLIAQRINNTGNIYSRLGTYADAVHIFEQHVVFGAGVNQFGAAEEQLGSAQTSINGGQPLGSAHDSFLSVLAEQGLWGFVPLLLLVAAWVRLLSRYRAAARDRADLLFFAAAVAASLAYLLMSVSETILVEEIPNAFFALIVGAAAGRVDALTEARQRAAEVRAAPLIDDRLGTLSAR
jgi:O-antigen ligase